MIGKSLLHYKITAKLGQGGMGEVYRATDSKLGREVAIKILPATLVNEPERIARFQREARTLASLNHDNIAGLFGFEEVEGQSFLVMELVEGVTLFERIEQSPIPLEEALEMARQIADGLEEAHEKGIVHRDLKPANVKVTPEGKVKILDFGLARAYQGDSVAESEMQHSPTITAAMTQLGVILGTAAYMSPEQAKGKTVDRRADLWSFGVILWEMLTGKRLFEGETTSDTLAAVLRADPPFEELPDGTPAAVERLLRRCLERAPRKRLRDIGEARVRLERWRDDPSSLSEANPAFDGDDSERRNLHWLPWSVAGLALTFAVWSWVSQPQSPTTTDAPRQAPGIRLSIDLPRMESIQPNGGTNVLIAPDGNTLAYLADDRLWIRPLDKLEATELPGTLGIHSAAFSPDGQWLAFTAQGKIWRTSITGGAPFEVCDAPDPRGCIWANDTTLVFSGNINGGLSVVSLQDGTPHSLTQRDPKRGERSHRWPQPLPDGESVLFTTQFSGRDYDQSDIQVVSLVNGKRRTVYRGGAAPRYTLSGHLLFARKNSLFAVPLDLTSGKTSGLVVPVLIDVWSSVGNQEADDGSAQYDVSNNGTLVYREGSSARDVPSRVVRLDLHTGEVQILGTEGLYESPQLSPDGKHLAVCRTQSGKRNIYIIDTQTLLERQLTFSTAASWMGCWSQDSRDLYWSRPTEDSGFEIMRQRADGSTPEEIVFQFPSSAYAVDVTPDGSTLLLTVWGKADLWDVYSLLLEDPDAEPQAVLVEPDAQAWGTYSPDGRWIIYGQFSASQVVFYLVPNPPTGARWEVARGRSTMDKPVWSKDLTAVFLRNDKGIVRIPLTIQDQSVRVGRPEHILDDDFVRVPVWWASDIQRDGSVAYVLQSSRKSPQRQAPKIVLVTDWFTELSAKVPGGNPLAANP